LRLPMDDDTDLMYRSQKLITLIPRITNPIPVEHTHTHTHLLLRYNAMPGLQVPREDWTGVERQQIPVGLLLSEIRVGLEWD
jgi:hypothetical protein